MSVSNSITPISGTSQVPSPRVVLVLAGAAGPIGRTATALEHAVMPQLTALGRAGRAGRLRTIAPHLPATEDTAAAALLGTIPPVALDPGAIAVESLGGLLAAGESCTVVEVLDHRGDPAPALDVQRAARALRHTGTWQRVVGIRRGHEVLLASPTGPQLPHLEGLQLVCVPPGFLPVRQLTSDTVVIAADGSTLLGVAGVLGGHAAVVDGTVAARRDPVPARLRAAAAAALVAGATTLVIETRAVLDARRSQRDPAASERAACAALERLDRELVGPLRSAAGWTGACLSVCADLPRTPTGAPLRGEVPLVMAGPRSVFIPEPAPLLAHPGTTLPPLHSERGVEARPMVVSPFTILPGRRSGGVRRFSRDPVTGRTFREDPSAVAATG